MAKKTSERFRKKRERKIKQLELTFGKPFFNILDNLYWEKKMTQEKIAKMIGFDRKFVIDSMKKYEIDTRPNYEHIQSLRGTKHPLYGKTWEDTYGIEGAQKRRDFFRKFSRELIIKRIVNKKFPFYDTKPELLMANEMKRRNISFVSQFNIDDKFVCDFAILKAKLIIECDGDFWHANPAKYNREDTKSLHKIQRANIYRDAIKDLYLLERGWKVLRFFELDIKKDPIVCVDKIEHYLVKETFVDV